MRNLSGIDPSFFQPSIAGFASHIWLEMNIFWRDCVPPCLPPISAIDAISLDRRAIVARAVLRRALLSRVVDIHDPKALAVAKGPLEVIHQRPGEIASQRRALTNRRVRGR